MLAWRCIIWVILCTSSAIRAETRRNDTLRGVSYKRTDQERPGWTVRKGNVWILSRIC
uniref:Uncharacterized protein n=1 Tax=Arundo donax TaxID=35708 RepID=A0A0A9FSK9_ARUDO